MSAVLKDPSGFEKMVSADLDAVIRIEQAVYTHPWTRGNFDDSLRAGYHCGTYRLERELIGYFVLMIAVEEAHLLNLSVAADRQRQGIGSTLLREVLRICRTQQARHLFLEVRPSNAAALALYAGFDFKQVAQRRAYYPAHGGREDALVLNFEL